MAANRAAQDGGLWAARSISPTRLDQPAPPTIDDHLPSAPTDVQVITYRSLPDDLALAAWYSRPSGLGPHPAIVYFHGDFTFEADDHTQLRRFVEAGYAVMTPTLRGENGNPGELELLWGEVEDAAAAVRWVAARPEVDDTRIYALGHSIGGGIAALLSLDAALPLRATASIGGIYVPETFVRWSKMKQQRALVRFDVGRRSELELRTLGPQLAYMRCSHVAFVGREDPWFIDNTRAVAHRADALGAPFRGQLVAGDHMGSREPGLEAFASEVLGSDDE